MCVGIYVDIGYLMLLVCFDYVIRATFKLNSLKFRLKSNNKFSLKTPALVEADMV